MVLQDNVLNNNSANKMFTEMSRGHVCYSDVKVGAASHSGRLQCGGASGVHYTAQLHTGRKGF